MNTQELRYSHHLKRTGHLNFVDYLKWDARPALSPKWAIDLKGRITNPKCQVNLKFSWASVAHSCIQLHIKLCLAIADAQPKLLVCL